MSQTPNFIQLYQVYTRVYLNSLSRLFGHPASLDDIPDSLLETLASQGFNWLYMLGIWETGQEGLRISQNNGPLYNELYAIFPDLAPEDICGSCFAIAGYHVHPDFGDDASLARLRSRMHRYGLKLMLDFVPNHTAIDHPWTWEHPEYYINGKIKDLERQPGLYFWAQTAQGTRILAHGKDPNFPAWIDTLQVDYSNPEAQQAIMEEIQRVAQMCDGLRCDMAMLALPDVFKHTWRRSSPPFWSSAITRVRCDHPDFIFMAEVYWDLEARLQELGFDYTYDKGYYDALLSLDAGRVQQRLSIDEHVLPRMAHFLENHDEPRAAQKLTLEVYQAAAVMCYLVPGLRFFQHGQIEGSKVRVPMQLARLPIEAVDLAVQEFYQRLLDCLRLPAIRYGHWRRLEELTEQAETRILDEIDEKIHPLTKEIPLPFISFVWNGIDVHPVWVIVNYSSKPHSGTLRLPKIKAEHNVLRLVDRLNTHGAELHFTVEDLAQTGLVMELSAWEVRVYEILPG